MIRNKHSVITKAGGKTGMLVAIKLDSHRMFGFQCSLLFRITGVDLHKSSRTSHPL